jgi:hypothetical protein
VIVSIVGGYPYPAGITATLIGHARCSTDKQDLQAQRPTFTGLVHGPERIKQRRLTSSDGEHAQPSSDMVSRPCQTPITTPDAQPSVISR